MTDEPTGDPWTRWWVDFLAVPGRLNEMMSIEADALASAPTTDGPDLDLYINGEDVGGDAPAPLPGRVCMEQLFKAAARARAAEEKLAAIGEAVDHLLAGMQMGDVRCMHSAVGRIVWLPASNFMDSERHEAVATIVRALGSARGEAEPPPAVTAEQFKAATITGSELLNMADQHGDWCLWRLDPERLQLVCMANREWIYDVDLERCLTAAQTLDWIAQVKGKGWASPLVVLGLVEALDDVLGLQRRLCSGGVAGVISPQKLADLVADAANRWPDMLIDGTGQAVVPPPASDHPPPPGGPLAW